MKTKEIKGITLVALVVTIVVLLILAGVSINLVLGDNGIITKAKEAQRKSAEASQNDLIGMNELAQQLEEQINGSTGSGSGNGGAGGSGAGTKVPAEATAETAPYFPDNTFTKKEGTIDTGLVIQDGSGNEYVWVVVPKSLYSNTNYNSNNAKKPSSSTDYANIEYCLQQYTATYRKTGWSDTHAGDTANVGWLTSDEYTELKNSMLKSVYENGGFYIGKYEAGIGINRARIEAKVDGKYPVPTTVPVSKADAYPYTYVTRTQAQNLAKSVNSGTKTSSLMFGVQWDLMLAFIHNKGNIADSTLTSNSTTIGNYRDSEFQISETGKYATTSGYILNSTWNPSTKPTTNFVDSNRNKIFQSSNGNGILVTTGTSEKNKVVNIYDIAGNVNEWILENNSNASSACVYRGGNYSTTGTVCSAAYRGNVNTDYNDMLVGFRISLF